jgi:hypothetical protein
MIGTAADDVEERCHRFADVNLPHVPGEEAVLRSYLPHALSTGYRELPAKGCILWVPCPQLEDDLVTGVERDSGAGKGRPLGMAANDMGGIWRTSQHS